MMTSTFCSLGTEWRRWLRTLLSLSRILGCLTLGAAAQAQPRDIVDSVLRLLGEPGPTERTQVDLSNGLTVHQWTNSVLGSRGIILRARNSLLVEDNPFRKTSVSWAVDRNNLLVAARFQPGARIPWDPAATNSPVLTNSLPILFAERFDRDGHRRTIGSQEPDVPSYFWGEVLDWTASRIRRNGWFSITRTRADGWVKKIGWSAPVVGAPMVSGYFEYQDVVPGFDPFHNLVNKTVDTGLIDMDGDGLYEIVVSERTFISEKTSAPGFSIPSRIETFERTLMPVEGTSIMTSPINTSLVQTSVVGPQSRWTNGNVLLYQNESGGSFDGGASTRETGSFVTPGFLGVRCSTTSGFRYGWIEWPNDPSVPVALMLRGTNQFLPRPTGDLLVRPIRTRLGRPGQSIITGQQSGPDLWVERGSGGQTRLRWLLESGQQIERWILGDPSGWQKYQTEGTDSALAEPSVPAALFRIRSSTN